MKQSKTNTLGAFFVLGILLYLLEPSRAPRSQAPLPKLGAVDALSLIDDSGKPFRLEQFRGKIVLLHFFYADCPGPCRVQALHLERLDSLLRFFRGVVIVSVTIDPEQDSPDVLHRYAAARHAAPGRWVFLTGPGTRLLQATLDLPVGATTPEQRPRYGRFLHATRLYLLDDRGWIRRCYYDGLHPRIPERVAEDVQALIRERGFPRPQ